ncbi:MAG: hypothetical protein ACREGA_02515 [Candidatus Saccharimonadales bacterium]
MNGRSLSACATSSRDGYREVDFAIIWDIVENHLTDFTKSITRLIN